MTQPGERLARVVGYVPLATQLELEEMARRDSRTLSWTVARLIHEALEQRKKKAAPRPKYRRCEEHAPAKGHISCAECRAVLAANTRQKEEQDR